jgi:hypothetical protein
MALLVVAGLLFVPSALVSPRPAAAYSVCSDGACIHEYMAIMALPVVPDGADKTEIADHFGQIMNGITHEDEFDHVYGLNKSPVLGAPLTTATHFWDADLGPDAPALNADKYGLGEFPNSWQKVKALWLLALGAYARGDKSTAYHYLGHVVHHFEDNTVPAHVHDDPHPNVFPSITGGLDDDSYHVWMDQPGDPPANARVSDAEAADLRARGPLPIPAGDPDKLHGLLYSTNQIADYFASDDYNGDTVDPLGLVGSEFGTLPGRPVSTDDLWDNDGCALPPPGDLICAGDNNDGDGDLSLVRKYSYLRGIRSVAALFQLFEETAKRQFTLYVVVDRVHENQDGEGLDQECVLGVCVGDSPDYFAKVSVAGRDSQNRGDRIDNEEEINPGWVFGNTVGTTGSAPVRIEIWDHDGLYDDRITLRGADDQSDIDSTGEEDDQALEFDVDLAKCLRHQPGAIVGDDLNGTCGDQLTQEGDSDDHESQVWFRVLMSKSPPTADAGGPYTTKEGTDVTLDGNGSTDPDNDITTYAWDLDGDGVCDDVANDPTPDFTAVGQDGQTTVKLCVTDAAGLTDEDTATVTVTNVAPTIGVSSDAPKGENTAVTVSGTISDPGWLDSLSGTISWGDGSAAAALGGTLENGRPDATLAVSASHTYGDNGTFTVQVCAADDDTNPCTSFPVQVTNTSPTAVLDLSGAVTVNGTPTVIAHAGAAVGFSGRSTDPGSDDLTLAWAWGDGTAGSSTTSLVNPPDPDPAVSPSIQPRDVTSTLSHTFGGACAYETTFGATDDDGGTASQTAAVIASRKRMSGRLSPFVSTRRFHSIAPLAKFIHAESSCWSKSSRIALVEFVSRMSSARRNVDASFASSKTRLM